jgi:hypothetical protein
MTETSTPAISYRSVTRNIKTWADCRGINHFDSGEIVTHDRCGAQVVIREDGRIFDVELSGFYQARKFSCYHGTHECDLNLVAARTAELARQAADGEIVKDATVEVFKGRKVAKGTVGVVKWVGDTGYGERVGLAVDGTEGLVYTAITNCRRIA